MTRALIEAAAMLAFFTLLLVVAAVAPRPVGDPRSPDSHLSQRN